MHRHRPFRLFTVLLAALALGACAGADGGNGESRAGEQIGTILGAIGGAVLASRAAGGGKGGAIAALAGAALGAWAGGNLGRMFDERDRALQAEAAEEAMEAPVGEPVTWSNPESGNSGAVTPLRQETAPDGATCRSFEQSVTTADGRTATEQGTACRAPDGTWRVVS